MSEAREWTQEQAVAFANELYPPGNDGSNIIGYTVGERCCIGSDATMLTPLGDVRLPPIGTGSTWREAAAGVAYVWAKDAAYVESQRLIQPKAGAALVEYESRLA